MNKLVLSILVVLLLSGCGDLGRASTTTTTYKPSYLQVFEAYKKTDLFKQCSDFGEQIEQMEPEEYHARPVNVEEDMEIVHSSQTDDHYTYRIKCVAHAQYQLNAFSGTTEDYEMPLGIVNLPK